jgi:hypothetical protein
MEEYAHVREHFEHAGGFTLETRARTVLSGLGFRDAEYPIWFGLFVPARTPREIVERLNRETLKALEAPRVRERLAGLGVDPMPMSPDEFAAHVERRWRSTRRRGIRPEGQ